MRDLTEQLLAYGNGVERVLVERANGRLAPRRRRPHRARVFVVAAAATVVLAVGATVLVGALGNDDGGDAADQQAANKAPRDLYVTVPDVRGKSLEEANALFADQGLPKGRPFAWDPDDPSAVVVAHEPMAGSRVPVDSPVGFRTALLAEDLCDVMNSVPPRDGDAVQTISSTGFVEMLTRAEEVAPRRLRNEIRTLLDHLDRGGTVETASARSLDQVTIQYRGCSMFGTG